MPILPCSLYIYSFQYKTATKLLDEGVNPHSICWSPANDKICFISNNNDEPGTKSGGAVCTMLIYFQEVTKVSNEKGSAFQPV